MDADVVIGAVGLGAIGAYLLTRKGADHMARYFSENKKRLSVSPQPSSRLGVRVMGAVTLATAVLAVLLLTLVGTGE
jgi:hypothetical protein